MGYKNKEDQAKAARKHYLENKDLVKDRATKYKRFASKRNKEYVSKYLENHPCVDCGEKDIIVLEFDHLFDKEENIANAIYRAWSLERIQKKIDKCEVRCANCHRRITYKRRNIAL